MLKNIQGNILNEIDRGNWIIKIIPMLFSLVLGANIERDTLIMIHKAGAVFHYGHLCHLGFCLNTKYEPFATFSQAWRLLVASRFPYVSGWSLNWYTWEVLAKSIDQAVWCIGSLVGAGLRKIWSLYAFPYTEITLQSVMCLFNFIHQLQIIRKLSWDPIGGLLQLKTRITSKTKWTANI